MQTGSRFADPIRSCRLKLWFPPTVVNQASRLHQIRLLGPWEAQWRLGSSPTEWTDGTARWSFGVLSASRIQLPVSLSVVSTHDAGSLAAFSDDEVRSAGAQSDLSGVWKWTRPFNCPTGLSEGDRLFLTVWSDPRVLCGWLNTQALEPLIGNEAEKLTEVVGTAYRARMQRAGVAGRPGGDVRGGNPVEPSPVSGGSTSIACFEIPNRLLRSHNRLELDLTVRRSEDGAVWPRSIEWRDVSLWILPEGQTL